MENQILKVNALNYLSKLFSIRQIALNTGISYGVLKELMSSNKELPEEFSSKILKYLRSMGINLDLEFLDTLTLKEIYVEVKEFYTREETLNNPNKIYVFGDNLMRIGNGGQAIIRGCNNAIGIATKINPGMNRDSFFTDLDLEQNKEFLIQEVKKVRNAGNHFVFPKAGLGTGLAELPQRAPQTYAFLKELLLKYFNFENDSGEVLK